MSSFRRKGPKPASALGGTRTCPSSLQTVLTSTGIPSLDDILGGGLPLSCSLLVLAPDHHTSYGELVQKYFIAQGLACGQGVCVVGEDAKGFVGECMWMAGDTSTGLGEEEEVDSKVKIAWRYEEMKRFETTVASPRAHEYCATFDLTRGIPESVVEEAIGSGQLICLDVNGRTTVETVRRLEETLAREAGRGRALRVCVPSLGCAGWGDLQTQDILRFLHSLRRMVRRYPAVCASVSLASHLCGDERVGWFTDGTVTLKANGTLMDGYAAYHGFVQVQRLPAPHTVLPPSDKLSTLRGLGSGENDLAFRCLRKRFVLETVHLDERINRRVMFST